MKTIIFLLLSIFFIFPTFSNTDAQSPKEIKVSGGKNGIYVERVSVEGGGMSNDMWYTADVQTKLCYAWLVNGLTIIPCNSLANRPEWKKIITWSE